MMGVGDNSAVPVASDLEGQVMSAWEVGFLPEAEHGKAGIKAHLEKLVQSTYIYGWR